MWEYLYDVNVNVHIYQTHSDMSVARKAGYKSNMKGCRYAILFPGESMISLGNFYMYVYISELLN